jgi:hypothetical protein
MSFQRSLNRITGKVFVRVMVMTIAFYSLYVALAVEQRVVILEEKICTNK